MNKIITVLDALKKKQSSIVFLGGVHGVGKTTMCEKFFSSSGYYCVTASSLIREYETKSDDSKKVGDIADNQVKLIRQLNIKKKSHNHILLDGHYCVIDNSKRICQIELDVFQKINPSCLFLLKGSPIKIASRLSSRDSMEWTEEFIEEFQKYEESHAKKVSLKLSIPLHIFYNKEYIRE